MTFRDAKGYAGLHYTDSTGRNDIIDADQDSSTGWLGYDLPVDSGTVSRFADGKWHPLGTIPFAVAGNELE